MKKVSEWVGFLEAVSAAMISRYETREADRNPECSSAGSPLAGGKLVPTVLRLLCVFMCQSCCPPVVCGEGGSQCEARLSFLKAGGRVHAAGAPGARVHGESSGLIIL